MSVEKLNNRIREEIGEKLLEIIDTSSEIINSEWIIFTNGRGMSVIDLGNSPVMDMQEWMSYNGYECMALNYDPEEETYDLDYNTFSEFSDGAIIDLDEDDVMGLILEVSDL